MKYNILLTGKNNAIMDEFFDHMKLNFNTLTSSMRMDDLNGHIDAILPDVLVYCLYNETKEDYSHIVELKRKIVKNDIILVIIGAKEDCDDFQKSAFINPDLVLVKPLTASMIQKAILDTLENKEEIRKQEEEEKIRAREEKEKIKEEVRAAEEKAAEDLKSLRDKIKDKARRRHVLIIDDDPMMLKVIKEHLCEKYDVATAISGKIAYKFLEHKETDLILLDYAMPVEDGPEVFGKLRANEVTKDIPIVFLTGITEKEKIQKALVLKPQGYLLKPIEKDKLMITIENLIG